MEYKKDKAFFTPPMKISVGNPINETYLLIKNFQYKERQILALRKEDDSKTIILVEATIIEGKLINISMVAETLLEELRQVLKYSLFV